MARPCKIIDCPNSSRKLGMCTRHYCQVKSHGEVVGNPHTSVRSRNIITVTNGVATMSLCNKYGEEVAKTIFDSNDMGLVTQHKWCLVKQRYAAAKIGNKLIRLHKLLTGFEVTDHINRNPLDNRRCNLRKVNGFQNMANTGISKNNTTGFKGVSKNGNYYRMSIKGYQKSGFKTAEEAAIEYDRMAIELSGEYACTNKMLGLLP